MTIQWVCGPYLGYSSAGEVDGMRRDDVVSDSFHSVEVGHSCRRRTAWLQARDKDKSSH